MEFLRQRLIGKIPTSWEGSSGSMSLTVAKPNHNRNLAQFAAIFKSIELRYLLDGESGMFFRTRLDGSHQVDLVQ